MSDPDRADPWIPNFPGIPFAHRAGFTGDLRPSDIFLAKDWQWGGPDGAGPCSDPILDVRALVQAARTGIAITDPESDAASVLPERAAWNPILVMHARLAVAFLDHPSVVRFLRAAPESPAYDADGRGFTVYGLGHFRAHLKDDDGDVVALVEEGQSGAGSEVARLHWAWQ